jgi:HlyD family secretion protein
VQAAQASVKQAEAALASARAQRIQEQVRSGDVVSAQAQVERSQAQLENATKQLAYTTILAPQDGVVIQKYVEEGTIITSGRSAISEGTNIVTIGDVSAMYVLADVDESEIAQVKAGQPARVEVESLPDKPIPGVVEEIFPRGVEEQNVVSFQVKVRILQLDPALRPGMTADVEVLLKEAKDVLYVPNEAIRENDQGTVVKVKKGPEIVERSVRIGIEGLEDTEVVQGLEQGEEVILETSEGQKEAGSMGGPGEPGGRDRSRQTGDMMKMMGPPPP